ncbi:MAG: DUF4362 domain-containing protein [Polyangiaceae bacterium]
MKNVLACLALLSVAALAAGCEQASLESTVQDFLKSKSLTAEDCGSVDLDKACSDTAPAPIQCFLDAYTSCKAAKLSLTQSTIEGDPIYSVYIVVPGQACSIESFVDTRQDQFGDKTITESSCTSPSGAGTCDSSLGLNECITDCNSGSDCG